MRQAGHTLLQAALFGVALLVIGNGTAAELLTATPAHPPAPGFALKDLQGRTHKLSDYRGKTVVVNFWGTWCPPCRLEMPSLQRAALALRTDGIVVVAIAVDDDAGDVADFLDGQSDAFDILLDEDHAVAAHWSLDGVPTTFVVDARGHLAYKATGARRWDDPAILERIRAVAQPPR